MDPLLLKSILILVALTISVSVSYFALKMFDNTKANISTRKIIGSTQDKQLIREKFVLLVSQVSFNKDETKKKLVRAGIYSDFIAQIYYLFKIVPLVISLSIVSYLYMMHLIDFTNSFILFSVLMMTFLIAPDTYVSVKGKSNIIHISNRLPFLLDLMNVCVHTGMTLEASMEYLSTELKTIDENLAFVVKKTSERAKIIGLDKALSEFYDLVPTAESQSFVMTLTQSLKYGSSVGAILSSLASDIREVNMLLLEEKIGKMGAKMSIPMIIFIMVPIVILIAAPGIMRMLG